MEIDIKMILPPGDILEDMMTEDGLTPSQLAEKIHLPVSCVEGILAAEHAITPETAKKLGKYFYGRAETWLKRQEIYEAAHGSDSMSTRCSSC